MAKTSVIERGLKRERLYKKFKEQRNALKIIVSNPQLSFEERFAAQSALTDLPRNSSPVRLKKRCSETGRARGFIGFFGVSRIVFRELASAGLLPGVKKASW